MLKHTWGKRIAKFFSMMFVLMLLISTFSVTVFAAETAPADAASMASGAGNVWTFVLATVAAVLLIACIILIYLLKTHKEAYMTKLIQLIMTDRLVIHPSSRSCQVRLRSRHSCNTGTWERYFGSGNELKYHIRISSFNTFI